MATKKAQQRQFTHETAMADKTLEANRTLALEEYNRNQQAWDLQNQYNLPSAQQQRFKDAGLNPNLIYGQGTAGNASEIPRYQSPTADYSRVASPHLSADQRHTRAMDAINTGMAMMDSYMTTKTKAAGIDNLKATTAQTKTGTKQQDIDFLQKRNLYGYDKKGAQDTDQIWTPKSGEGLTDYNQRLVDQQYQSLQQTTQNAERARIEAAYKQKQITQYERDQAIRALGGVANTATRSFLQKGKGN